MPQPGVIREVSDRRDWSFPGTYGSVDLSVGPGAEIRPDGDGFLGVLLACGNQCQQALNMARGILGELWISGGLQTNERFLSVLLSHPWVREGMFHAAFIEEEFIPTLRAPEEILRIAAAACHPLASSEGEAPLRWYAGDFRYSPGQGEGPDIRWEGEPQSWEERGMPGVSGYVETEGTGRVRLSAYPVDVRRWLVRVGHWFVTVRALEEAGKQAGRPRRVTAIVGGRVHALLYQEGAIVPPHEPVAILESIRTLVPHALPVRARLLRWSVSAEESVRVGQQLAEFELAPTEN